MFVSSRKFIKVRIFDDEEYEKNEVFSIELGEPYLTRRGSGKGFHHFSTLTYKHTSFQLSGEFQNLSLQ